LSFVPGREQGIVAYTDATGHYRIPGAPVGHIRLRAEAPGWAAATKSLEVGRAVVSCDFELVPGSSLQGVVFDKDGKAIPFAKIRATCSVSSAFCADTTTREDGMFEFVSVLRAGYSLKAEHEDFVTQELGPISAPAHNIRVRMQRLPSVQVQVNSKHGWMLREFDVMVKQVVPKNAVYRNTLVPRQHVVTNPGIPGLIRKLPPSDMPYVLQIEAPDHAHGFSEPFLAAPDTDPVFQMVRLGEGGSIEMQVLSHDGKFLQGVVAFTTPIPFQDDPISAHDMATTDTNLTRAVAKSGMDGHLTLSLLAPGRYMVKLVHPEHCSRLLSDIDVVSGDTTRLGKLVLVRGTRVSGAVTPAKRIDSLLRVLVVRRDMPTSPTPQDTFCVGDTVISPNGSFRFKARIPPGRYHVVVGRSNRPDSEYSSVLPLMTREIVLDENTPDLTLNLQAPQK